MIKFELEQINSHKNKSHCINWNNYQDIRSKDLIKYIDKFISYLTNYKSKINLSNKSY